MIHVAGAVLRVIVRLGSSAVERLGGDAPRHQCCDPKIAVLIGLTVTFPLHLSEAASRAPRREKLGCRSETSDTAPLRL